MDEYDNVASDGNESGDNNSEDVVVPNIWKRMYESLKPEEDNEEEHRRIIRKIERAKAMTRLKRKKNAEIGLRNKSFAESCLECDKVLSFNQVLKITWRNTGLDLEQNCLSVPFVERNFITE